MSLVYVNDVADVIVRLMDPKPEVFDQAFNLAFKETPTLLQLLGDMKVCTFDFHRACNLLGQSSCQPLFLYFNSCPFIGSISGFVHQWDANNGSQPLQAQQSFVKPGYFLLIVMDSAPRLCYGISCLKTHIFCIN